MRGAAWPADADALTIPGDPSVTSLTGSIPGLASQAYEFRVRARNDRGHGPWSNPATLLGVPGAPSNVTASALNNNNNGTDRLTWDTPTNTGGDTAGITYDVQRRQAGQTSWQTAVEVTGTQHDFAKEPGTSGSAYDYRVQAKNSVGNSAWSSHVTVAGRPGAINNLAATASTSTVTITLSWTAPSNGGKALTGYRIEWRPDVSGSDWSTNPATGRTTAPGGASTFTVDGGHGLAPATAYDFRIRADNPDRSGFYSNTDDATTAADDPPAAPVLTATAHPTFDDRVNLSWTEPDDGGSAITGYRWEARVVGLSTWPLSGGPPTPTGTTVVAGGVSTSLATEFRVFAINAAGDSPPSEIVTGAAPPGAPTGLEVRDVQGGQVTLEWTPASATGGKPVTGYTYQWGLDDGGATWPDEATTAATSAVVRGLTRATDYQFRVRASNEGRTGGFSAVVTETTLAAPVVSVADAEGTEGGRVTFTVSLSQTLGQAVTVNWATSDGTGATAATEGSDYRAATGSVTIGANRGSATFSVQTLQDILDEPDETFTVRLFAPSGGLPDTPQGRVLLTTDPTATGTIADDDPLPFLQVGTDGVREGDRGTSSLVFSLVLEPESGLNLVVNGRPVTVDWAIEDGTATAPDDYRAASGTVTFAPGERRKLVTVQVAGDRLVESDETVVLALSNLAGATFRPSLDPVDGTARVWATIDDDDAAPTAIELNASSLTVSAGAGATTVTVTASFPSGTALSTDTAVAVAVGIWVNRATDAARGRDYTAVENLEVTIEAGRTTGTAEFELTPVQNDVEDGPRYIWLAGTVPEEYGTGSLYVRLRLIDDDAAATLAVHPAEIVEGEVATVTARLNRAVAGETTLTVSAAPETGTDAGDFTLNGATLTIPAGQTASTGTVTVTANEDGDEEHERVRVSATASNAGAGTVAAPAAVTLAIRDNDVPNVPATGAPSITGTAQVGQELTAGAGTIADADGLTNVSYSWQWVRVESGGTESDIGGATSATYTPVAPDDVVRTLKVRASFTDDAGNPEALTSAATAAVTAAGQPRVHRIGLFPSAARRTESGGYQGFARIINRSEQAGEVHIKAFDDEGVAAGPVTLIIGAGEAVHFNSDDLEEGNPDKGLSGGVGDGTGDWRLELASTLDLRVLGYIRTDDGFVTSMHDLVPRTDGTYRVVFFNPGSNTSQVSRLRLVNPGAEAATVTIEGIDDDGLSPGETVMVEVPAGAAETLTAQALESGEGLSSALGDGKGKWRLKVSAERPIEVMSLLASPTGHLSNLSTVP